MIGHISHLDPFLNRHQLTGPEGYEFKDRNNILNELKEALVSLEHDFEHEPEAVHQVVGRHTAYFEFESKDAAGMPWFTAIWVVFEPEDQTEV